MTDFTTARINMVDSQIHTMGVVNDAVLEAYRTVARENFVPSDKKTVAYNDEDLPLSGGRCLMEPVTHARLMQAAAPVKSDRVLDIGGASGYSAAILSGLVESVVAVEQDSSLMEQAKAAWADMNCANISAVVSGFAAGSAAQAPYSLILVNGSVAEIPAGWVEQLSSGGRMLVVVRKAEDRIGRALHITKNHDGSISERILFDASVPYLPGHESRNGFVF
ncbi:MAG: protein-L-isoaspartate O-methyltransferase [Micavibrio aeruginosavorus]|uniref:Protein-L-isoaspartate O-methyltransferase n=1 Tax=Micavibrio aeruginosavorus TaxID=349221 RepID=A0A2W4ZT57_9BACT|nr:MAG: protein-L-isoaspartate O-methyltransferase [Micavibrio aeruginosavorus]